MRNMSFALTSKQILNKTKTVTRRLGWKFLNIGDLIQPVEKCMGLKKDEKVKKLGCPIRIIYFHWEPLDWILENDVIREGYPALTPAAFVVMFCRKMKCNPNDYIRRIEFEYTE
jgi:hypothetical protein